MDHLVEVEGGVTRVRSPKPSPVKHLPGQAPQVVIATPVGTKPFRWAFPAPDCERAGCSCPVHGRTVNAQALSSMLVPYHWAMNAMRLLTPMNTQAAFYAQGGKLSAESRDEMTRNAIEAGAKYIFYWDDDVIVPPLTLYTMHTILETHPDIGLVSGVYTTREDPPVPLVYKEHLKGPYWGFSTDPASPPEDIFAAGGGCLMARLEDVKKMTPPYWADEQIASPDGQQTVWGHDVRFCKKFKEESGKRVVVQGSLLCKHFDAQQNRFFELPPDSPPMKRKAPPTPQPHEVLECGRPFTREVIMREIERTAGKRRLFLVPKTEATPETLTELFGEFFETQNVFPVDSHWLCAVEGLKNGNRPTSTFDPGQPGNGGSPDGGIHDEREPGRDLASSRHGRLDSVAAPPQGSGPGR